MTMNSYYENMIVNRNGENSLGCLWLGASIITVLPRRDIYVRHTEVSLNRSVLIYRSPVLAKITTIRFPFASVLLA